MKLSKAVIKNIIEDPIAALGSLSEEEIAAIIQQASCSYYNTDKPLFPDNTFDIIKEYLEEKNPKHPILKNVGCSVAADDEKKTALPYFMGSLDKIKTDEKLVEKFKKSYPGTYLVSDKLDGNSAMIVIKPTGKMVMYSRGDGEVGQNISHLLPFIRGIPSEKPKKEWAIRGELICSKENFKAFDGKMANARNMVAGLINAKVPDLSVAAVTQFVAYEVVHPKLMPEEQMNELKSLGFNLAHHMLLNDANLNITKLSDILVDRREKSPFEIDGIVVMHNAMHKRVKGNPKYGFAFKSVHTMQSAEVIVTHVEWNMSKDGYLIPVVNFQGVNLAGVVIKRAHGFNGKFINENKIGPGSKIEVIRSGDVIPYISKVLSAASSGQAQMPDVKYRWSATGVDIIIVSDANSGESEELKLKNLEYFFDKIEIPGLSSGNVAKIFKAGFKEVGTILNMSKSDFLKVEGFKEKMAEKLFSAMQEKKKGIDCVLLMDASNTLGRGFGSKKIKLIVDAFPAIVTNNYIPNVTELVALHGVEKKTAEGFIQNIPKYFKWKIDNGLDCIDQKKKDGVDDNTKKHGVSFEGQAIVFTGFRSKPLEDFITNHGGQVTTSVSKKTTLVLCKSLDEKSSKIDKANELGVKVMIVGDFAKQWGVELPMATYAHKGGNC